jgi:hypothetical protein
MAAKNTNPKLRVVLGDVEYEVQTKQSDLLRYEMTARKHGWGMLGTDEKFSFVQWSTFLAWVAGKRTGAIADGLTWEAFADEVDDVEVIGGAAGNPTQQAPELEASSN